MDSSPIVISLEEDFGIIEPSVSPLSISGLTEFNGNDSVAEVVFEYIDGEHLPEQKTVSVPNAQYDYYFYNFFDEDICDFIYDDEGDKLLKAYTDEFWCDEDGDKIILNLSF